MPSVSSSLDSWLTSPAQFVPPLTPINLPVRRCTVTRDMASKRILIMRLAAYGDVLMATPLLRALREAWPDAHLTWIVERAEADTIQAHPDIDELLLWEGKRWKQLLRRGLAPLWLLHALALKAALRQRHFDAYLCFQPEEWPLMVRASGAPLTVGVFDTFRKFNRNQPTSPRTRLYSQAYTYRDLPPHRTDQYLLPLRDLGLIRPEDRRMTMGYTAEDAAAAGRFLEQHRLGNREKDQGRIVVIAPRTTWPSRCWPAERYVRLADALTERGCRVVLIGSPRERSEVEAIAAQMAVPSTAVACGTLTFRQAAALIARASLLVSGDTGPMHTAAAVGTPFVALFGPTDPANLAPLTQQGIIRQGIVLSHPVPCGPCDQKFCPNVGDAHLHCQRLLTVDEVLDAAMRLLSVREVLGAEVG